MKKIAVFDTKPYDKEWFEKLGDHYTFKFIESKLNKDTAGLAKGCQGVCAFVNDEICKETIEQLEELGIPLIAMRCAGYSNVDFKAAYGKIHVVRVPVYSPHAVAEHTMALLLAVNRKIHKAYNRTRDFNFSLNGLTGMDLYGKTIGIIGTGKIGQTFIEICKGFGMRILAYDLYPAKNLGYEYVDLDTLFRESDVISLHCPLTEQTKHILSREAFHKMKKGVYIINTSRGTLIETEALLEALNNGTVAGAGLDVYEEEAEYFFEDMSGVIMKDDMLSLLVSKPNVLLTSHQAFLTNEALENIARVTIQNLDEFFEEKALTNEVCYHCQTGKIMENCRKNEKGRCF
ncbi:2-hydroxyacid dehydrogenase [Anaerosporobacter faecicola]|uniref:2-hydroxyacid dehydrogenase n=1 Tax=Anaerosporobacter faecicola TaxID=2718714 RepID=UPI001A9AE0BD|nr:2-hydroxyacid dehydrogenase [Anaerosporobacter faecicola]